MPSVLVENPWNTARTQARQRPPLEDAFAVGGMAKSLPSLPRVVDTQGIETPGPHHGLPVDPTIALPPAPLRSMSASASPAASPVSHAPGLDAPLVSSSSAVGEAPRLELSESSGEMDPLGVGIR